MNNRKYFLRSFPIFLCLIVIGCAASPPSPSIKDGYYINPEYGFSIKVPEGWQALKELPEWYRETLSHEHQEDFRVMFINDNRKGIIVVASSEWRFGFISLHDGSTTRGVIDRQLHSYFKQRENELTRDPRVKRYSYEVKEGGRYFEAMYVEMNHKELKMVNAGKVYDYKRGLYEVHVYLLSDIESLDGGYEVYRQVVESLQTGKSRS
jgi:hypothetical protein